MDMDPRPSADTKQDDDDLAKYNLDNYDDEDSEEPGTSRFLIEISVHITLRPEAMGPFSNIKGLTYYRNNDEDPYITLKEVRYIYHRQTSIQPDLHS